MEISFICAVGAGDVYQGSAPDNDLYHCEFAHDPVLVDMAADMDCRDWVRQGLLKSVWYFGIDDTPESCLDDRTLLALAFGCTELLQAGNDVLFSCTAGVSRSSYADCATLMHARNLSFDAALALVRSGRPTANPNSGFVDQLRRVETQLRSERWPWERGV